MPSEVALFLNFIGIPYPDINEDDVRALGMHVRNFARSVAGTHELATGAINEMGSVFSGESYQQLVASWARMSASHMADLDRACHVVAEALNIAAEVITAVKFAVLTELAALAASYAVVLATPGAAAYTVAVREVAGRLCRGMEDMLLSYIAAEVIGKAIEPLEHTIDRLVNGVVLDAAHEVLGVPSAVQGGVTALYIEPDEVLRYANILDNLADDILEHAATFADNVAGLDFTTSDNSDVEPDSAIARPIGASATSIESPPFRVRPDVPLEPPAASSSPHPGGSSILEADSATRHESRQLSPASLPRPDLHQPAGASGATAVATDSTGITQQDSNIKDAGAGVQTHSGRPREALADQHQMPDRYEVASVSGSVLGSPGHDPATPANHPQESGSAYGELGIRNSSNAGPAQAPEEPTTWSSPQQAGADSMTSPTPWARSGRTVQQEKASSKLGAPKPSQKTETRAAVSVAQLQTPWSKKKRGLAEAKTVGKVFAPTHNDAVRTSVNEAAAEKDTTGRDGESKSSDAVTESRSTSSSQVFVPRPPQTHS